MADIKALAFGCEVCYWFMLKRQFLLLMISAIRRSHRNSCSFDLRLKSNHIVATPDSNARVAFKS